MRGDDIRLFVRDPRHLIVSWSVAAATRLSALRDLGPRAAAGSTALRLAAADGTVPRILDLPPAADASLLEVAPGTSYVAEIGIRTASGDFTPLVRSALATIAAERPPVGTAVEWVHAAAPTVVVAHAWSGGRVPPVATPTEGPRSSEVAYA